MKQTDVAVRVRKLDAKLKADAFVVPVRVTKGKIEKPDTAGFAAVVRDRLNELIARYHGAGSAGAIDDAVLPAKAPFGRLVVVSVGDATPAKQHDLRNAAGSLAGWCARHKVARAVVAADALKALGGNEAASAWVEGAVLGSYRYIELRSRPAGDNNEGNLAELILATSKAPPKSLTSEATDARKLCEAVNLARTLGHTPPNIINPVTLARRCQAIARQNKLRCRVIVDRQTRAKKMGAILAVGGGSATKPRIIILEHPGTRPKSKPITLVGKALTMDTGGYSIKPSASIPSMKYDKCGGMAVIGTLVAAAQLKLKQRIVGVIGAAENMISADAYRPGDIIRAANGKTIEVLNTDAEGRLVLADCLHYAEKTFDPSAIIDLATLTGAINVALADVCAGIMSNDDKLADALIEAGQRTHERLWRLPTWPEYREMIVGTDGDIKNTGGSGGGSITAAMFLKEFVGENRAWAHLDIASVADTSKATPICPVGGTGFGVRLLIDYIRRQ